MFLVHAGLVRMRFSLLPRATSTCIQLTQAGMVSLAHARYANLGIMSPGNIYWCFKSLCPGYITPYSLSSQKDNTSDFTINQTVSYGMSGSILSLQLLLNINFRSIAPANEEEPLLLFHVTLPLSTNSSPSTHRGFLNPGCAILP